MLSDIVKLSIPLSFVLMLLDKNIDYDSLKDSNWIRANHQAAVRRFAWYLKIFWYFDMLEMDCAAILWLLWLFRCWNFEIVLFSSRQYTEFPKLTFLQLQSNYKNVIVWLLSLRWIMNDWSFQVVGWVFLQIN